MRQGIGGEILRWAGSARSEAAEVDLRASLVRLWIVLCAAGLLTVIVLLPGCGTYAPPKLALERAGVVEATAAGKVIEFELSAENVNSEPLPLRGVRYDVYVNGDKVFEGSRSAEATLRPFGTQSLVLPAAVGAGSPLPSGSATVEIRGELIYQTPGIFADILFDNELRTPSVSFDGSSTVALP